MYMYMYIYRYVYVYIGHSALIPGRGKNKESASRERRAVLATRRPLDAGPSREVSDDVRTSKHRYIYIYIYIERERCI